MNAQPARLFAFVIGLFLLTEGLWGLRSPVVFWVLTTNLTHAIIHLLLGLVGIFCAWRGGARGFCLFLGALLFVVGLLRFLPYTDELVVKLFNVNPAVAWLNMAVGAIALLVARIPSTGRNIVRH